jgi:hypothetical protein
MRPFALRVPISHQSSPPACPTCSSPDRLTSPPSLPSRTRRSPPRSVLPAPRSEEDQRHRAVNLALVAPQWSCWPRHPWWMLREDAEAAATRVRAGLPRRGRGWIPYSHVPDFARRQRRPGLNSTVANRLIHPPSPMNRSSPPPPWSSGGSRLHPPRPGVLLDRSGRGFLAHQTSSVFRTYSLLSEILICLKRWLTLFLFYFYWKKEIWFHIWSAVAGEYRWVILASFFRCCLFFWCCFATRVWLVLFRLWYSGWSLSIPMCRR